MSVYTNLGDIRPYEGSQGLLRLKVSGYRALFKIANNEILVRNLAALKPLLSVLAEPSYTIEPASPAECKRIEKRAKEYHEDPSSFVSWKEVKRKLKAKN